MPFLSCQPGVTPSRVTPSIAHAARTLVGLATFVVTLAVASVVARPAAAASPAPRPRPGARATPPATPLATPLQERRRRRPRQATRPARPRAGTTRRERTVRRAAAPPAPRWTAVLGAPALAGTLGGILTHREGWGVLVTSVTRGDTLFSVQPDVPLVPASTLKMYTAALALDRLGPDWRFRTEVLRDGPLEADGTVRGNLVMRGDGDPAFSRRFHPGIDYGAPIRHLADRVVAAGVKRVTGDVVADASAFEARTIPEGWLTRYAGAGYAAPFSALSLNENIVVIAVHPDGRVLLEPATTGIRVESTVSARRGDGSGLRIFRATDGRVVARGWIGTRSPVKRLQLTVADPATYTAGALHAALLERGVVVEGQLRAGGASAAAARVAALESPRLAELVAVMNRESVNHFAELIFRNAVRGPARTGEGSAITGNALLQRWMAERAGAPGGSVQVSDGSGLSVLDRVTPRSMIHLLAHAHQAPWGPAFHASLPVAGESELMRNRMRITPAEGNLHAKTGTTNDVVGLGGYVTAVNGEVLAFCFLFNGRDRWNARATMDAMGATLAAFARE